MRGIKSTIHDLSLFWTKVLSIRLYTTLLFYCLRADVDVLNTLWFPLTRVLNGVKFTPQAMVKGLNNKKFLETLNLTWKYYIQYIYWLLPFIFFKLQKNCSYEILFLQQDVLIKKVPVLSVCCFKLHLS